MNYFGHDNGFWGAVGVAVLIRVLTAEHKGSLLVRIFKYATTVVLALASALVFVDPVLDFTGLPPDIYKVPVAVLIGITGESLIRMLINITWANIFEAVKAWRGK